MLVSNPMPLEYWLKIQTRLETDYQSLKARLDSKLQPMSATIETLPLMLERTEQARQVVFATLNELQDLQMLMLVLGNQLRQALFDSNCLVQEAELNCLRNMAELYQSFMLGLPQRLPLEQDMQMAATHYHNLRNAGNNDVIQAERLRLINMSRLLVVMGSEDTTEHQTQLRALQFDVDQIEAELQSLKALTRLPMVIPERLAYQMANYGIALEPMEPAAEPVAALEAATEEPADAPTPAPAQPEAGVANLA